MKQVDIGEAKANLSRMVEEAARGEPFVIAKAGRPLVKVVPIEPLSDAPSRRFGFLAGQVKAPDDFVTMGSDEVRRLFEGG